jgi:hypothetical protein
MGQRERVRQNRQRINDFVSETIKLQGENPTMSPDLVARQAALNITEKDPEFDPGIVGGFQKFASGLDRGPSTVLTGPIAEGILNQPTGIDRAKIKEAILASQAARRGTAGPVKPTAEQKQRDSDLAIINRKTSNPTQVNEAKARVVASGQLVEPTAPKEQIDKGFSEIMDGLKKLSKVQKGDVLDRRFGKEAFDAGLEKAEEVGWEDGINPESVKRDFEEWWDEQFEAEKDQTFQKFQDRAEFQEVAKDTGIAAKIEEAFKAGTITQEQKKKIESGLAKDPTKAEQILQALQNRGAR